MGGQETWNFKIPVTWQLCVYVFAKGGKSGVSLLSQVGHRGVGLHFRASGRMTGLEVHRARGWASGVGGFLGK